MLNGHVWLVATLLHSKGIEYAHCDKVLRDRATISTEVKSSVNTAASPAANTAAPLLGRVSRPRRRDIREDTKLTRWETLQKRALTKRAGGTGIAPNNDLSGEPRRWRVSPARPAGRAQIRRRQSVRGVGLQPLRKLRRQREEDNGEAKRPLAPAVAFSRPSADGGGR